MVATRSLQLTVKKNTRSQKTLEGQLLMLKDGERTAISSRVAELDQIMPQYLGVSKAILDSVIFCHQDESLWPMSEPSVLKKRFDEIFEALKYTKAIDNIKILRKKQNEELAKFKIIEQHAREDKDKGERAEKRSTELYDEIEILRTQSTELGTRIKDSSHKAEEAWEHAAKFEKIVARLEGRRIEAAAKQESVDELRKHTKEMSDSDEELQGMLEQYEERVSIYQDDLADAKKHYSELNNEIAENQRALTAKEREMGSFEAQKQHYERQLENRENLVKETASRHNIRGFDFEVSDEQVRSFMEKISRMAREQNATFERARRETQEELQKAQTVLNQINEKKSALNQSKESARAQIAANERKIGSFQTELNKIDIDEGGTAALESRIGDVDGRLRDAKAELEANNWDQKVADADVRLRSLDDTKEKLDAELVRGTRLASESARMDYLQKELKDRQSRVQTMSATHGERIKAIVRDDWKPSALERDYEVALSQSTSHLVEAERQRDGTSRELELLDLKLHTCRNDLKRKRQDQKSNRDKVMSVLEETDQPQDYPETLRSIELNRDTYRSDVEQFGAKNKWYSECLQTANESNSCRLCCRPFKASEEERHQTKEKMITRIRGAMDESFLRSMKEQLAEAEKDLAALRGASAAFDTWERLTQKEIPSLEHDEKDMDPRREKLLSRIEEQDRVVEERRLAKGDIESSSRVVQSISKSINEMDEFENQIRELAGKQKTSGLSRGLEQIQDDLKKVGEESKSVKSALAILTNDRDRARSAINDLELESRDVKSKLSTAVFHLKEKRSLEKQIGELKSSNTEQREHTRGIDQELQTLGPKLLEAQANYDYIAQRGAEKDRELQQEASKLSNSVQQLKMVEQDISSYIDRGGPQQIGGAKREIERLRDEMAKSGADQQRYLHDAKKIEDLLRNHEDTKRSITDNQRYRRDVRALRAVHAEIEELEAHNAEADKDRYERQGNHWQMERNKLAAEQASLIGQLKSKDDQLKQLIKDWETDYKDAAYKYKEAHIKVETTKAAVEDLGRYGGALDKAIMKYHSLKMEEINRIIEELWKKTYQGTDVDTILIRSDNENLKGNKSYNYRVCMVKQDAEMDMRGRCSAGQKVLASIIIRLALAECFGVNCGLIALDEPTTNLDRDNIRALAESLAEIIRVRRQQRNFQLIVITHDEDFLRYMQCADFSDFYYRVSRNERQKSIIERQSIAEVI
ncbi:DNA repair protein rad50 [Elasticomyces elasticus]|nr:DNA repair protein rad50 [Elasticomyces elasticus]